jgi:two-component system, OmpR family, alkaline phosphatase synthesis response regulator PhoP
LTDTPVLRRILVADDEPHIGRIIKMKLERGPFDVTLAFDGQEAADALLTADPPFDMALLDLMMPNLSGIDVLRRLKASDRFGVPTVILTAAGQDEQQRAAMDMGATVFLTKPFSPKKLYALVAELTGVDTEDDA